MLEFAQFIQQTAFFTELRGSGYVYPVILSLHMVGRGIGYIELPLDKIHAGWVPPHAAVPAVYLH